MAYLALDAVSAAVYTALNVAALTALVPGGISDALPQAPSFPCLWYEVSERDVRGFGTGGLPEITLRVHAFSTYEGLLEAQRVNQKVIELLRDQALTVAGYTQCGRVFYDETVPLPDEVLNGVRVKELVSSFRIYVEE
jgi:hypothetical protein